MPTSPHDGEAGLTLVEMLLVLAILALASGLVLGRGLPGGTMLDRARLDGFLVDTRVAAMRSGQYLTLAASGRDIVARQGETDIATLSTGAEAALSGPVWFRPDGTSNGGRIVLSRADGTEYGADIAAPTGRITLWP
ncbi:prepilin-type N-terminal cleavage/methylation domain-containing protein [Paragemmobacter straminiformis]|uniref:Prepilin-type N-terminal cleavage/methylation domain-containing protein n=1 Tax=Paragemmobacter straminiformis TaxID=2045119 RepID=A0A842IAB9_9RHOB|nr:prepilin-type N-terminal cleavage/methylation domain-containing protein [Gemmobacter straminiformis]MBC2836541.1 prepilin-type N-terminal cleavage/methylation domain-containing protein [Gemmobacter straminiformis]